MEKQVTPEQEDILVKQGYRFAGSHSAVKTCQWTRNAICEDGICYKQQFYGIKSHQCIQMTTSMFCANRCTFCWRGEKAPVSTEWIGNIDDPVYIVDNAIKNHVKLLQGFKGDESVSKKMLKEMENPKHAALSLTGDSITYPFLPELLDEFHKRRISTFLVTNAQYPEKLEKIDNITQLYISLDAPNKQILKQIDRPLFPDFYERLLKSLDVMSKKKYRTCIRLTLIKGVNDADIEGYSNLIHRGNPDFVEVKGFTWVGASRTYHKKEDMPEHNYVKGFSKKLEEELKDYELVDEHVPSCAVLLVKKTLNKKRFINFKKFFELISNDKEVRTEYYTN